jgi:hypothetical protein
VYPSLPEPDRFGNYWLGRKAGKSVRPSDPAVFPQKRLIRRDDCEAPVRTGKWLLWLGREGFAMSKDGLREFSSPQEALAYLNVYLR